MNYYEKLASQIKGDDSKEDYLLFQALYTNITKAKRALAELGEVTAYNITTVIAYRQNVAKYETEYEFAKNVWAAKHDELTKGEQQ